ncbi:flagellar motor protein MotS [Ornithinibacillus halophilus]|uniref:Chemotaxis protein MotB n=1 Tax=Ornithinibacillus halophilus TaxID=930117 RepID=A0A1M5EKU6_9BACI|nr:flagellar motor protein MotS [Ornithinibacillus halophilus]SHF79817.1 chemotaxis protein MotB [Ornithinibacillus halophilus]
MKRRTEKKTKNKGAPKWMVTYSDMVTLILVFFILLFSISQIDSAKFDAVTESFRNRVIFDFNPSPIPMDNPTEHSSHEKSGEQSNEFENPTDLPEKSQNDDIDESKEQQDDSLTDLMSDIEVYLNENELNNVVSATRTERGVVLVLQDSILFDPGEAEILSGALPFLSKVGVLLEEIPNDIKVEGHTDTVPMSSYRYPSNWELSGARASSVVRYLIESEEIDEARFSISGYGETRPVASNDNEENRKKNRRVEIIILNEDSKEVAS